MAQLYNRPESHGWPTPTQGDSGPLLQGDSDHLLANGTVALFFRGAQRRCRGPIPVLCRECCCQQPAF